MDKDVLLGVVSVDEAIAALDVEPLDSARDLAGDDLLRFLRRMREPSRSPIGTKEMEVLASFVRAGFGMSASR